MMQSMYPVRELDAQVKSLLETVARVKPDGKPKQVHTLRTSVRRVEAQLELLSRCRDIPDRGRVEKKVRRRLRKLRRGAGAVRDCDVQIELIRAHIAEGTRPELDRESRKLRRELRARRKVRLQELLTLVDRQQPKLARQMEKLLRALAPAGAVAITQAEMTSTIEQWVGDRVQRRENSDGRGGEDRLHDIRKTAKLARYIAETAPESASGLRQLGQSYEALQQSGGAWHDWLTLWRIAKRHVGKSAALTRHFEAEHERSQRDYEETLARSRISGSSQPAHGKS